MQNDVKTWEMRINRENEDWSKDSKDLALLISKLQLGQDEMSFGDYMVMEGENNIACQS